MCFFSFFYIQTILSGLNAAGSVVVVYSGDSTPVVERLSEEAAMSRLATMKYASKVLAL